MDGGGPRLVYHVGPGAAGQQDGDHLGAPGDGRPVECRALLLVPGVHHAGGGLGVRGRGRGTP